MKSSIDFFGRSDFRAMPLNFWERLVNDEALKDCSDLEKIVAGCELIATLDQVELLHAA